MKIGAGVLAVASVPSVPGSNFRPLTTLPLRKLRRAPKTPASNICIPTHEYQPPLMLSANVKAASPLQAFATPVAAAVARTVKRRIPRGRFLDHEGGATHKKQFA